MKYVYRKDLIGDTFVYKCVMNEDKIIQQNVKIFIIKKGTSTYYVRFSKIGHLLSKKDWHKIGHGTMASLEKVILKNKAISNFDSQAS